MKFRNAHFKNLPMSDAVKVTLPEMILNDYTEILIETLGQDVLRMTTVDWIDLLLFPIKIILIPLGSYLERKNVVQYFEEDSAIAFTTYQEFRLFWRDFSDFETKPYKWNYQPAQGEQIMNPQELDDFLRLNRMTGNELAAKLGVHYVTISRWRNGREPIPKTVELALKWVEAEGRIDKGS